MDLDDPQELPGLLFRAADGPRLPAVAAAVREVLDECEVVAVGLSYTYRPWSRGGSGDLAGAFTGV